MDIYCRPRRPGFLPITFFVVSCRSGPLFVIPGPVVAMVWEGKNVVKQGRQMLGETDPLKSKPGSIRGDFSIDMGRNIIHGSDSVDSANAEIELWFKEGEIMDYQLPLHGQVFEWATNMDFWGGVNWVLG